jgi:hypothetical protein
MNIGRDDSKPGFFTADLEVPGPGTDGKPVIVPGSMKPIHIERLPLMQQAIAKVLGDEVEKAQKAGITEPTITVTRDMLNAKVKELKEQRRRHRQNLKPKNGRRSLTQ